MGLDVVAYSKLVAVPDVKTDEEAYSRGLVWIYRDQDFPKQRDGLAGAYEYGDTMHFRAGSYSSYGRWRDQLAQLVATEEGSPFSEIIFFSDCEGVIGPKTSAKLLADFKEYEPRASVHPHPYFYEIYNDFLKAFLLASDNGFVKFC